jgi:hypothetical protein
MIRSVTLTSLFIAVNGIVRNIPKTLERIAAACDVRSKRLESSAERTKSSAFAANHARKYLSIRTGSQ